MITFSPNIITFSGRREPQNPKGDSTRPKYDIPEPSHREFPRKANVKDDRTGEVVSVPINDNYLKYCERFTAPGLTPEQRDQIRQNYLDSLNS